MRQAVVIDRQILVPSLKKVYGSLYGIIRPLEIRGYPEQCIPVAILLSSALVTDRQFHFKNILQNKTVFPGSLSSVASALRYSVEKIGRFEAPSLNVEATSATNI